MKFTYIPKGVCSRQIDVEIENGILISAKFTGGCAGNTAGITKLVEGLPVEEVIKKLRGIPCGSRKTSCPDQLSIAVEQAINNK